jgi:hypothetical protein
MITTSESPQKGSVIPNQLVGVLQHTVAISGSPAYEPNFFLGLAVIIRDKSLMR